jgi:hypothetical protein
MLSRIEEYVKAQTIFSPRRTFRDKLPLRSSITEDIWTNVDPESIPDTGNLYVYSEDSKFGIFRRSAGRVILISTAQKPHLDNLLIKNVLLDDSYESIELRVKSSCFALYFYNFFRYPDYQIVCNSVIFDLEELVITILDNEEKRYKDYNTALVIPALRSRIMIERSI